MCELQGLGFSTKNDPLECPVVPKVTIAVNDVALDLPEHPVRSTNDNGYTGYDQYEVDYRLMSSATPKIVAVCDNPEVKIDITQPKSAGDKAVVKFDYNGVVKTYTIVPKKQ